MHSRSGRADGDDDVNGDVVSDDDGNGEGDCDGDGDGDGDGEGEGDYRRKRNLDELVSLALPAVGGGCS